MDDTDEKIIREILNRNIDAYKVLVDRYADAITNLCWRYLGSQEEAEDATQDVFLKAYQALEQWEPKAKFKTWLYRIAINHCLNLLKRRQKVSFQSLSIRNSEKDEGILSDPPSREEDAETGFIKKQRQRTIQNLIRELPINQRHVIILFYYQNLSYKEVAEVLNISINSVESRLFRAKQNLAKKIQRLDWKI